MSMLQRFRHWLRRTFGWTFFFTVLLPTAAALIYYSNVASDVYISESRFVVRYPQRQLETAGLGALLQSTGFSRAQDDSYSVHDFVTSRDALRELDEQIGVKAKYSAVDHDRINRFPGLDWDDSFEAFHRYFRNWVTVDYDTASSISVLRVRAFTADDAVRINELLLQLGERLVNNLNKRSRQDLIEVARKEVKVAEDRAREAALALSAFRSRQEVFDPEKQSALQLSGVAKIREELIATEAQLEQLRRLSPRNPNIGALKAQVDSLRKAAKAQQREVTGKTASLVGKSAAYDRLAIEKGFADRQLGLALASLDTARSEAARKQLYLERLVQPNRPDRAMEPRRIRGVITVFVLGLVAWGVFSLLLASVKEHLD